MTAARSIPTLRSSRIAQSIYHALISLAIIFGGD
jgi:hypothetical protein